MGINSTYARVALYSHDTYGLGHLTRTLRLAGAAVEALPKASVLILSGSPVIHRFELPPRTDYVKLPSVVKVGPDAYEPRSLRVSPRTIRAIRAMLIRDTLAFYRPHLFMVDNVPLGMRGELRPTLKYIKSRQPQARICLNLRDVLDDPEVIAKSWKENGVPEALDQFYDSIHVFGRPEVYDAVGAYHLPPEKTFSLGYIPPSREEQVERTPLPPAEPGCFRILVTVGGGGDGDDILRCVVELQRKLNRSSPFHFYIVTGPLMNPATRVSVERSALELPGITLHEYVEHLPAWMRACDLVLSMGGYNTICEVMASAKRSVVFPRVYPRREQEIRARALEGPLGLTLLHRMELDPPSLDKALRHSLEEAPHTWSGRCPALTGVSQFKKRLQLYISPAERATGAVDERPGDNDQENEVAEQATV